MLCGQIRSQPNNTQCQLCSRLINGSLLEIRGWDISVTLDEKSYKFFVFQLDNTIHLTNHHMGHTLCIYYIHNNGAVWEEGLEFKHGFICV